MIAILADPLKCFGGHINRREADQRFFIPDPAYSLR